MCRSFSSSFALNLSLEPKQANLATRSVEKMSAYEIEESVHPLHLAITLRKAPSETPLIPTPPRPFTKPWLKKHFRHVFCRSKAAHIILLWNVLVGATFGTVSRGALALGFAYQNNNREKDKVNFHITLSIILAALGFIALIQVFFYPVGGLIADIKCGRYKVMSLSTLNLWCGHGILLIFILLSVVSRERFEINRDKNGMPITFSEAGVLGVALILFIFGFTGFQANAVQFGLDQLQDAPSEELSSFLHWFIWTDNLGQMMMSILVSFIPCNPDTVKVIIFAPIPFFVICTVSLVLSWCNRGWFHSEPRTHNPYGTVYKVLKYVVQHSKPERPRAETYCDTERPRRIEFAKDRFGGPFTAPIVEDVKTLLRIVVMLLALGPIHTLAVGLNSIFPLYGLHLSEGNPFQKHHGHHHCPAKWVLFESGNLAYLVTVVFLPLYIIFVLPCKRHFLRRILSRLGFGMFLMLLTSLTMLTTHIIGNHYQESHRNSTHTDISCLFNSNYSEEMSPTLHLPPWVHVFPNVLNGMANPLVYITILEFISAQSPHTMKGLLLGAYYAVRGLFTIIGYIFVFPFVFPKGWKTRDGSLLDCGVGYYIFNSLFGAIGLVLLLTAARWYQYRQRGERPYEPWGVEDIYQEFMNRRRQRCCHMERDSPSGIMHSPEANTRILQNCSYGAT